MKIAMSAELMIRQRFNLFYAGFTVFLPAMHYNLCALNENVSKSHNGTAGIDLYKHLGELILDTENEAKTHLTTTHGLATTFELAIPPLPNGFSEYFAWQQMVTERFEEKFPMSRIDHYYFLYGRKNAEIICNTSLIETLIELHVRTEGRLEYWRSVDKYLKDNEYILFKLIAASALLSSEPRQTYFSSHYTAISSEFNKFKNLNLLEANKDELLKTKEQLEKYRHLVMDGFKKCIRLLQEIQL